MFTNKDAIWEEVHAALNTKPDHFCFWGGRAHLWSIDDDGTVEVGVLEGKHDRVPGTMAKLGYVQVGRTTCLDLGDEDCPKPEIFTKWRKPGIVGALENTDLDELFNDSLGG